LDVQAATDAWLARLPEAQRLAAQTATDTRLVGWIAGAVVFLAAAAIVARSGVLEMLVRRIEANRPRPWLAGAAAAGALALVLAFLKALVDAAAAWRVDAILAAVGGAPPAGLGAHLAVAAASVLPSVAAAVVLLPPLAWLMRRRPSSWPLIAGGGAMALIMAVGWLPYALSAGPPASPAPPGPAWRV
jgi:hypothetical protein